MNAIVALPDEEHSQRVAALWEELERNFGVRDVRSRVPWPHISFQGAQEYDIAHTDALLRAVAMRTAPFTVYADGLGIFTGPQPVLYIAVQRSEMLNTVHDDLWRALAPSAHELNPYYTPERWAPHVTLAQWDIPPATLGRVVARFGGRPLEWRIPLVALGLVIGTGEGTAASYRLHARYPLCTSRNTRAFTSSQT